MIAFLKNLNLLQNRFYLIFVMQTGTVTTGYHRLAPSATDQIHLPPRRLANRIFTATTAFSALNHSDFGKSSILSSRIFLVWSGSALSGGSQSVSFSLTLDAFRLIRAVWSVCPVSLHSSRLADANGHYCQR